MLGRLGLLQPLVPRARALQEAPVPHRVARLGVEPEVAQRLSVAVQLSVAQEAAEALGLSVAADPRAQ